MPTPLSIQFLDAAITLLETMQQPYQTTNTYVMVTGGGPVFFADRLKQARQEMSRDPLDAFHPLELRMIQTTITTVNRFALLLPGIQEQSAYREFVALAEQVQAALTSMDGQEGGADS